MPEHSTKMNSAQMQVYQSYENELRKLAENCSRLDATQADAEIGRASCRERV